jgi:hypothetical protein
MGAYIVRGHPAGTSQDFEDTMAFSPCTASDR